MLKHPTEVAGIEEPTGPGKCEALIRHQAGPFGAVRGVLLGQQARRLRPRARRRAMTWRPLLVAMRARKPWVRLRFNTLG